MLEQGFEMTVTVMTHWQ